MVDINLLPDDQREAEERELRRHKPSSGGPVYSQPAPLSPGPAPAAHPTPPPPAAPPTVEAATAPPSVKPSLLARLRSHWRPAAVAPSEALSAIEVNLIPVESGPPSAGQLWSLVVAAAATAAAVAAGYILLGSLTGGQQRTLAAAHGQAVALAASLEQQQPLLDEMAASAAHVAVAQNLLDSHVYWTSYFRWLERVTLPDVYYSGFMGDVVGRFSLSASAPDYVTLAQQLVALQGDPMVVAVDVSEANRDSQGWVNFTLTLTVDPALYHTPPSL